MLRARGVGGGGAARSVSLGGWGAWVHTAGGATPGAAGVVVSCCWTESLTLNTVVVVGVVTVHVQGSLAPLERGRRTGAHPHARHRAVALRLHLSCNTTHQSLLAINKKDGNYLYLWDLQRTAQIMERIGPTLVEGTDKHLRVQLQRFLDIQPEQLLLID